MASSSQNPPPEAPLEQTEIEAAPVKPSADTEEPVTDNTEIESFALSEPISGVESRVLRPSSDSTFTCHVFSDDNELLATGETNGVVSIWKTSDYRRVTCAPKLPGGHVSAIVFRNGNEEMVAVDKEGNIVRLQIRNWNEIHLGNSEIVSSVISDIANDTTRHGRVEGLVHQFSKNGDVLTSAWHGHDREGRETVHTFIEVLSLKRTARVVVRINSSLTGIPDLSENGRSILISAIADRGSFAESEAAEVNRPAKLEVIPAINFGAEPQNKISIDGERAAWGDDGNYLLVWETREDQSVLSVYETRKLESVQQGTPHPVRQRSFIAASAAQQGTPHPVRQRSFIAASAAQQGTIQPMRQRFFTPASAKWEAIMLRPMLSHRGTQRRSILISGIIESKRICFVWDCSRDVVMEEIRMTFCPERTFERPWHFNAWKLKHSHLTYGSARSDEAEAIGLLLKNAFPDVCLSVDERWIASVSRECQTVAIASRKSGVTVWTSFLPDDVLKEPFLMPEELKFDPNGRHLLVFGDGAIYAFGPKFLQGTSSGRHMKEHRKIVEAIKEGSNPNRQELIELCRCLSSEGLAKTWKAPSKRERRIARLPNLGEVPGKLKVVSVTDATLSPVGDVLSQIVRCGTRFQVYTKNIKADSSPSQPEFLTLSFPELPSDGNESFIPEKVFLYDERDKRLGMGLLSTRNPKIAVFCDFANDKLELVPLKTTMCLKICRSSDTRYVYLLDGMKVHKLDLQDRSICGSEDYKSDLSRLIQMLNDSCVVPRCEDDESGRHLLSGRCISDDGRTLLLAWDAQNNRSVTVTADMEHSACEELINSADGHLSTCCALSADGDYVAFFDVEDLKRGLLSVKVFSRSEKELVFEAEVDQVSCQNLSSADQAKVLSNVFCGFSRDSKEVIVATTSVSSTTSPTQLIKSQTKTFKIQPYTRFVPNYDLLSLENGRIERDAVDKMHELHGLSLFNTPHPTGKTVFQDAFINDRGVIAQIRELAENGKEELGLEWNGLETEACNILDHSLKEHSTNDISLAVKLVCSEIAPFSSAAAIMKGSFKTLIKENSDIMEDAMRENPPVREACKLDVHVDFLNPTIGREKAFHISTSDTYLDWSSCGDKKGRAAKWKKKHKEIVTDMEKGGNSSTKEASLKFVCIENAAKVGKDGILRPLLLQKVAAHVFEFDVVKWVILFKWQHIWKKRFFHEALIYGLFLICFTLYATLLSASANLSGEGVSRKWLMNSLLGVNWGFGIWMAAEEVRQIRTYVLEGGWKGLLQFDSFKWNILDLASSALLVILIPLAHILALHFHSIGRVLSLCVALEALLASVKVWYYAQPFQVSGALVRLINDVANDCLVFLVLGAVILFGFRLSLHVLFQHVNPKATGSPLNDSQEDEECDAVVDRVHEAFGTLLRSLLTLFYALVGDFDQEIYLAAGNLSVPITIIFILYMLSQMIVLLNLLISIMGDTFDRVKGTQKAQLLIGRAQLIDSCEAGLREATRKKINKSFGRYLCVLVDPEEDDAKKQGSDQWMGKIDRIETSCRKSVRETENRLVRLIEGQMTNSMGVERKVQELSERLDRVEAVLKERNDETMTILNRILEHVCHGVAS